MPMVSITSSRVAPCLTAASAWKATQPSQRIATEMPRARSSLVFPSSAFGSSAARASAENAFIVSVDPVRTSLRAWDSSVAIRGQSLCGPDDTVLERISRAVVLDIKYALSYLRRYENECHNHEYCGGAGQRAAEIAGQPPSPPHCVPADRGRTLGRRVGGVPGHQGFNRLPASCPPAKGRRGGDTTRRADHLVFDLERAGPGGARDALQGLLRGCL